MEQHLCIFMNKKLTLHIRNCRKAADLCPVLSHYTNDHVPVNTKTMDFCLNIVGLFLSAICCNLIAVSLWNNHFYLIKSLRQYDFILRSEFDCICSGSTCFIFYSYLFHYSFRKSFRRQKFLQVFHNHLFAHLPDEASSRSTRWTVITRQSLFLIYHLLLPPMFN